MSEKYRKCFVLREVEVPMLYLRKGDIFRLEGNIGDPVNQAGFSVADTDAQESNCSHEQNQSITATPVHFRRQALGTTKRFIPSFRRAKTARDSDG